MTRLLVITTTLLTMASAIAWQYRHNQQLVTDLAAAQQQVSSQQLVLKAMNDAAAQRQANQRQLATTLQNARTTMANQLNELQRLEHENQQYRDWAAQPVPESVASLQQQPTSLSGRHQSVPERQPLQSNPNVDPH
jgi:LysB family phage lysis regulatory protein